LRIEQRIFELIEAGGSQPQHFDPPQTVTGLHSEYVRWLAAHWKAKNGKNLKLLADCAHGAASAIAPEVFAACGIATEFIYCEPNGRNINENCGALHPEVVAREVTARKASVGVTFDGDADRCLFADEQGRAVNGDGVLLLVARSLQGEKKLS